MSFCSSGSFFSLSRAQALATSLSSSFQLTSSSAQNQKQKIRYAMVALRTFMDPNNASDVKAANEMQDGVKIDQKNGPGTFEVPLWNSTDVVRLREALEVLAATKNDTKGFFGQKGKINDVDHLLGTASGWGGNPASAASEWSEREFFFLVFFSKFSSSSRTLI